MYTQCPYCGKAYPVTKKQQRTKKAQIFCSECKKKFNVSGVSSEKKTEISDSRKGSQPNKIQQIGENKTEITPTLLTEAKAEFIPKEDSRHTVNPDKKPEIHPYLTNINSVLRKSTTKAAVIVPQAPMPERLPWESKTEATSINWSIGALLSLLLFLGQAVYFELPKASQNAKYRPFLEKLCQWVGCKLAAYENLSELTVMKSSFAPQSDQTIVFKTVINNQAAFKQRLPNIQLNLLGYNEELIAQRVFSPKDYLPHSSTRLTLIPDETVEAKLVIALPETPVGGYNFNLVY